jgi:hypothetical protein
MRLACHMRWCVIACFVVTTFAQTDPSGKQSQKQPDVMAINGPDATAPSNLLESVAQVNKLAKLIAGKWDVLATQEPTATKPKGLKDAGLNVIVLGPGALSLVENYHTEGDSGSRAALGVIWWDARAHGYRMLFCDNWHASSCSVYDGVGQWVGDELVFQFRFEAGDKKIDAREVISAASTSSFTTRFYESRNGGPLEASWTVQQVKRE